jgi:LmbE family N-acetylglucosaminyl deacetylase
MKKILVVAAHPDDEILGCGGTLLKSASKGAKIKTIILSEGVTSRLSKDSKKRRKQIKQRFSSSKNAHSFIRGSEVICLNLPDQKLDTISMLSVTQKIETEVKKFKPDTVYTHHHGDLNLDHRIVNNATITACRPTPECAIKQIFTFEIPSSTDWQAQGEDMNFAPNYFNDISKFLDKKIKVLKKYKLEMRKWPHSRSFENIKNLAKTRGASVGCKAAEAFKLIRSIEK